MCLVEFHHSTAIVKSIDIIIPIMEESQPTDMPTEAQKGIEVISKTLDDIESSLVRPHATERPVELQNITQSFAIEVERLRELIVRLENQVENKPKGTVSSSKRDDSPHSDAPSDDDAEPRSTSELKLAGWDSIPRDTSAVESIHPALFVLVGEIEQYDAKQAETINEKTGSEVEVLQKPPTGRYEMPGFIAVTSRRLISYIDYLIHDGTLSWITNDRHERVHYTILRPFKMLVFYEAEIRSHLIELEERRRTIESMTEDEYEEGWRAKPPSDGRSEPQFSNTTVPELTGLIKDFRALNKFMDDHIAPAISRRPDEKVYFSDLWYTFPTGSLIYTKDKKVRQKIWRVVQRTGGRCLEVNPLYDRRRPVLRKPSRFVIDCYYTDFDGNRFFPVYHRIFIDPFDGLEPIMGLPACPLQAAAASGNINLETMVERGREFLECARPTHRDYTGRNQLQQPNGEDLMRDYPASSDNVSSYSEWIDSEVMVDMERALHAVPAWRPSTSDFSAFKEDPELDYENIDNDSVWDRRFIDRFLETEAEKWQRWTSDNPPTEREDLLLLPGRVYAFVFRTRKWGMMTSICTPFPLSSRL